MADDKKPPRDPFAPLPLSDELQKAGEKSGPLPKAAKRAVDSFAPLAMPKELSGAASIKPSARQSDSAPVRTPSTTEQPPAAVPPAPPVEAARVRTPSESAAPKSAPTTEPLRASAVAMPVEKSSFEASPPPAKSLTEPSRDLAATSTRIPTRAESPTTIDLDDDDAVRKAGDAPAADAEIRSAESKPTRAATSSETSSDSGAETSASESRATRLPTSAELIRIERPTEDAMAGVDDFLKDAVGKSRTKKSRDDDDAGGGGKRSRGGALVAALTIVMGAGIAGLVLLGRLNHSRYVIKCSAEQVSVERGRSFPPWGTARLIGAEWAPVKLPPEAACTPRETEDLPELSGWFVKLLEDQATALLTAREVSKGDEAEADLKQALLVSRGRATEDVRIDTRARIERLLGDVSYWRASAKLNLAAAALDEAAKDYEAAAVQKPRYVTDASAWAIYLHKVVGDLQLGPAGAKSTAFAPMPSSDKAPLGSELPIEPAAGSGSDVPAEPSTPATGGSAAPTGGVLL
ncbi:hypothetical protein BH11MYX2_BH11MYX2_02280 [soil metagenome]